MEIIVVAVLIGLIPATVARKNGRSFGLTLFISLIVMFAVLVWTSCIAWLDEATKDGQYLAALGCETMIPRADRRGLEA
jgi:hypothetical protein